MDELNPIKQDSPLSKLTDLEDTFSQLLTASQKDKHIQWLPVRHHSPACAWHALAQLEKQQPEAVLIEAPSSFRQHLPALQGEDIKPPIAIYQNHHYFPFAENSPEWQALRWAGRNNKPVYFIDLDTSDEEESDYWDDSRVFSSEFSQSLQTKMQCRDNDEVWFRLFEQSNVVSSDSFFQQVLLYCAATRACFTPEYLQEKGDLAREKKMRAEIAKANQKYQSLAVLTGGFHTSALFGYDQADDLEPVKNEKINDNNSLNEEDESYLIRFNDQLLASHSGYASGMPYPSFSRWHFQNFDLSNQDWCLFLLEKFPSISLIYKKECFEHLSGLCQLRQVTKASSFDLIDSLTSCLIKNQLTNRELKPWKKILTGNQLGDLPSNQPSLPLIENLREQCRSVRLKLDGENNCHFDLYQLSDVAKKRRQLLQCTAFLELRFANPKSYTANALTTPNQQRHESWSYHWTPIVEASLTRYTQQSAHFNNLVMHKLLAVPQTNLSELTDKIVLSLNLGFTEIINLKMLDSYVTNCSDIMALSHSFMQLFKLGQHPLYSQYDLTPYYQALWRQIGYHLGTINNLDDDVALKLLMDLQAVARLHEATLKVVWRDRLLWLIKYHQHKPTIYFSLKALLVDLDGLDATPLIEEMKGHQELFPIIEAVLKVVPNWINDQKGILTLLNHWLMGQVYDDFIEKLPVLRAIFSSMDAREIDSIVKQLLGMNAWKSSLNWLDNDCSESDLLKGIELEQALNQQLQKQGLSKWRIK